MPNDVATVQQSALSPAEFRVSDLKFSTATESRRKALAAPYKGKDIEALHNEGIITIKPHGTRILLRAVLHMDASDIGDGVAYNARDAVAHVIEAIGAGVKPLYDSEGCPEEHRLKVGDNCFVLSTVADRSSKTDKSCRLWLVDVRDVSASWRFADAT